MYLNNKSQFSDDDKYVEINTSNKNNLENFNEQYKYLGKNYSDLKHLSGFSDDNIYFEIDKLPKNIIENFKPTSNWEIITWFRVILKLILH